MSESSFTMMENQDDTANTVQGNTGEMEGNAWELEGNARELQGTGGKADVSSGKVVFDQIVETLRENDDAKRELYREIRTQLKENVGIDINPEPYLEKWLGEREDKKQKLEDLEMPLRELAENTLQMTNDGYSPSQIAKFLNVYPSEITRILKERARWEKEIRHEQVKNRPFLIRAAKALRLI